VGPLIRWTSAAIRRCPSQGDIAAVKSFKDVWTHELTVAAAAEGGSARDFPIMLDNHNTAGRGGVRESSPP
jgi:hypothetical protein